jgi:chromosome segregation ATPase
MSKEQHIKHLQHQLDTVTKQLSDSKKEEARLAQETKSLEAKLVVVEVHVKDLKDDIEAKDQQIINLMAENYVLKDKLKYLEGPKVNEEDNVSEEDEGSPAKRTLPDSDTDNTPHYTPKRPHLNKGDDA